jgi:hypothetical protein
VHLFYATTNPASSHLNDLISNARARVRSAACQAPGLSTSSSLCSGSPEPSRLSCAMQPVYPTHTEKELTPYHSSDSPHRHTNRNPAVLAQSLVLSRLATGDPLLPSSIANLISALSIISRISLRTAALFVEAILESVKNSASVGLGLTRRALIAAVGSARTMHYIAKGLDWTGADSTGAKSGCVSRGRGVICLCCQLDNSVRPDSTCSSCLTVACISPSSTTTPTWAFTLWVTAWIHAADLERSTQPNPSSPRSCADHPRLHPR